MLNMFVYVQNQGHRMCLSLEAAISAEEQCNAGATPFFPITIGRSDSFSDLYTTYQCGHVQSSVLTCIKIVTSHDLYCMLKVSLLLSRSQSCLCLCNMYLSGDPLTLPLPAR